MQTPKTMSRMLILGLLAMSACKELPTCDESNLAEDGLCRDTTTPDTDTPDPIEPNEPAEPQNPIEQEPDDDEEEEEEPTTPTEPVEGIGESGYPILNYVLELENFNATQDTKVREALRRVHIVINSKAFQTRVINHTFQGNKTFVDNRNMSNLQIYEKIMSGQEDLLPRKDHTMNLSLSMYYKYGSTVGYTYPDTLKVWVNSRFFNTNSYGRVAANVVHEWTHKLGFEHSYYNDYARPYSVPYGVGTIIEELVDKMK